MMRRAFFLELECTIIILSACSFINSTTLNSTQQFQTAVAIVSTATAQAKVFNPTPTAITGTGTITGRVYYLISGKPAGADYWIDLGKADGLNFIHRYDTYSDKEGRFSFSDVPVGEWVVLYYDLPGAYGRGGYGWRKVNVTAYETITVKCKVHDLAINLISPVNTSLLQDKRPVFQWEKLPDIYNVAFDHYALGLSHQTDQGEYKGVSIPVFTLPPFRHGEFRHMTTETSISPGVDLKPGHYHWEVKAYDSDGKILVYCNCLDYSLGGGSIRNWWRFDITGERSLVTWLVVPYDSPLSGYGEEPLQLQNDTGQDFTINLAANTISIAAGENKGIQISPGSYNYTATVPDLPSVTGSFMIEAGQWYLWTIYVSSSTED